ncbi:MAG: tetratricopeptide repeat protein [Alphaproteobacteria bacterium]
MKASIVIHLATAALVGVLTPVVLAAEASPQPGAPATTAPPAAAPTTTPPPAAATPAEEQAAAAKAALAAKDLPGALAAFLKARELAPGNKDYLHNAAQLAAQLGRTEQALGLYREAFAIALRDGAQKDAAFYDEQILTLRSATPEWVQQKITEASAMPQGKQRAAMMWSKMSQAPTAKLGAGDHAGAEEAARQAVAFARDNLGERHIAVIFSTRDLALVQQVAGRIEDALKTYDEAIKLATDVLGAGHPETLKIILALARMHDLQLKFADAATLYEGAVAAYGAGEGIGSSHPSTLTTRVALARNMQNRGRYREAVAELGDACPTLVESLGEYHSETARCRNQLASVYRQTGDFQPADELYGRIVPTLTAVLGASHTTTLSARNDQADLYLKQARYKEAATLLTAVLADAARDPANEATARLHLAQAHDELGEYAKAEPLLKAALDHQTRTLGTGHPYTITTLNSLAGLYRKQGRLAEAEATFNDTYERYRRTLGEKHPSTIVAANNVGEIFEKKGLYDQAEPFLRVAFLDGRSALGEDHPTTIGAMNNLALLHESQGNFEKAEPLYKSAIAIYERTVGPEHPNTLGVTNNLAFLYMLQQKYAEADPVFQRVLDAWTKTSGPKHQNTLKTMNNLARVKAGAGQAAAAEALFKQALGTRTAELGPKHLDTLRSMMDLGEFYRAQRRFPEAKPLLENALKLDEEVLGAQHPYTFEALNSLSQLLEDTGDLPGAVKMREKGFQRRTEFLNRMLWVTGENAREGYVRLHAPELHAYLDLLTRIDKAEGGRKALEVSLKRKGLLLKIASEIQQITRLARDPALTAIADELHATRKRLAALTLSGPTPETKDNHVEVVHELEEQINLLQGQLGRASVRFQETAGTGTVEQIVTVVPDDAALVDFFVYKEDDKDRLLAATVLKKKDKPPIYSLVKYDNPAQIAEAVQKFRKTIQDEEATDDDIRDVGQSVYGMVWTPLGKEVAAARRVYLVPDGILNILPVNAIVTAEKRYLIEDVDLSILSSVRDLMRSRVTPADGGYLINAGPDYNLEGTVDKKEVDAAKGRRSAEQKDGLRAFSSGMRGLKFDPLPGAEKEGRLIVEKVEDKKHQYKVFNKAEAQEQVLKGIEKPPEILHIATHGFFLKADDSLRKRLLKLQRSALIQVPPPGDNPLLRSGLAFAGINSNAQFLGEIDTENDGVLTALEVLGLNLSGTKLAVLSACETGLGEIHEGEGVYGLRRAFQEAGVRSVISSLWEVSDAGTQTLMTQLYGKVLNGMPTHQALRETQIAMLKSSQWNNPYIWSAFMMVER